MTILTQINTFFSNPYVTAVLCGTVIYLIQTLLGRKLSPQSIKKQYLLHGDLSDILDNRERLYDAKLDGFIGKIEIIVESKLKDATGALHESNEVFMTQGSDLIDQFIKEQAQQIDRVETILNSHSDQLESGNKLFEKITASLEQVRQVIAEYVVKPSNHPEDIQDFILKKG